MKVCWCESVLSEQQTRILVEPVVSDRWSVMTESSHSLNNSCLFVKLLRRIGERNLPVSSSSGVLRLAWVRISPSFSNIFEVFFATTFPDAQAWLVLNWFLRLWETFGYLFLIHAMIGSQSFFRCRPAERVTKLWQLSRLQPRILCEWWDHVVMPGDLQVSAKACCLKNIPRRVYKRKRCSLSKNCDKFHSRMLLSKTLQK